MSAWSGTITFTCFQRVGKSIDWNKITSFLSEDSGIMKS
ncbi:hypothetical protein SF123566_9948 [Shigella flexneri 1235-66]|nr:hypothetical protein SF123566_9948 [Shigella flexneri 1235-66]